MGGLFALSAALFFSIDNILMRKGLTEENSGSVWVMRLVASLTSLSIFFVGACLAAFLGFNVIQEFNDLSSLAVLLLILAGVLGPSIGALLNTTAISQIGASHASALWAGSNPIFAVLFAIVLLGEIPDFIGIFSVLIIVGGIVVIGYHGHEGTVVLLEKTKFAGGLIALLSGVFVALSQIGRGAALNLGATPVAALFVFQATAFITVAIGFFLQSGNLKYFKQVSRKSLYCYASAGIGFLLGNYCFFTSLTLLPVWQAVAIRNVQPIIVVFLSWLFLKKVDKISLRLVSGVVMVTFGIVILNMY